MSRLLSVSLLFAAACQPPSLVEPDSGTPDAGAQTTNPCRTFDGRRPALGLNDVSLLLPLDAGLVSSAELMPRALYDRLVLDENGDPFIVDVFAKLELVAVRFDLCDRTTAAACSTAAGGVLRLVLQPNESGRARDTAFHAFYRLGVADQPLVLDALERLSSGASTGQLAVRDLTAQQKTQLA
ncbi:MAG: hypothetical protein JNK82_14475, partial [Myxococcaceae bacterium]|nr:hypothetical protein [Myxococcaceae bacterium]